MPNRKDDLLDALRRIGTSWGDFLTTNPAQPDALSALEAARQSHNRILLVGNGPISRTNLGKQIDAHPFVVRFNTFTKVNVGTRMDLHVVDHKTTPTGRVPTLDLTCPHLPEREHANVVAERVATVACPFDPTRGFYMLCMCRALGMDVTIVGFGGVGHHEANKFIGYWASMVGIHSMPQEHSAIRRWVKAGAVRSLTPIKPSANVAMLTASVALTLILIPIIIAAIVCTVRRRASSSTHS